VVCEAPSSHREAVSNWSQRTCPGEHERLTAWCPRARQSTSAARRRRAAPRPPASTAAAARCATTARTQAGAAATPREPCAETNGGSAGRHRTAARGRGPNETVQQALARGEVGTEQLRIDRRGRARAPQEQWQLLCGGRERARRGGAVAPSLSGSSAARGPHAWPWVHSHRWSEPAHEVCVLAYGRAERSRGAGTHAVHDECTARHDVNRVRQRDGLACANLAADLSAASASRCAPASRSRH
jgi:hypothetical protein